MKKLLLIFGFLGAQWAFAGEVAITSFQGLNTQDNPAALEDSESQDLLNVGITPGGKSVYKREGYGLHKTLSFSTSAVHGLHYFQDTSGSDIQLYGHDIYIAASVNGASPVDVATITVNSTMQCTDNSGFAYCLTSSRSTPVRTSGTTGTTSFQTGIPLGTMITNTPDRLVVAGVSGAESTLYWSQANTFTNFVVGINSADPFTEVINSPGSRLTHIRYACGKLLWWKDGSFGYSLGSDQFNLENVTISQTIGTLDNSSDEYNGIVYFRGQDNHIYAYDCANVTRLSRKITPTVAGSGRRRANSWTQTTKSDWDAGSFAPSANFSTSLVSGDIVMSSFSSVDTSSADFVQGTLTNLTLQPASLIISTNAADLNNNGFETGSFANWAISPAATFVQATGVTGSGGSCSITPQAGSNLAYGGNNTTATLIDTSSNTLATLSITWVDNSCSWVERTLSGSGLARQTVMLKFTTSAGTLVSDPFISNGSDVKFYTASTCAGATCVVKALAIDNIHTTPRSSITSASFISRTFDTGISSATVSVLANWTANDTTPYVESQTSSNGSPPWLTLSRSTGTSASSLRYVRYISSFTPSSYQDVLSTLDDVTVIAKSTGGIFYSAVNNATGVNQWSTFGANDQQTGGTLTYYVRASSASFIVTSSTPVWVAQSKNSTVNYATGTYMQARVDFATLSSSSALALNDFTFNWFEGAAADKAYIKYWNDYVWVAVSSGTSGLNNRIQRWDVLNQTWLLDNIAANGFLVSNNELYFGSPSVGKIYKYGSVSTDDSGAINSYWRSKNFTGADPFVQNTWDKMDFVVKQSSGTFLAVDYRVNGSTVANTYSLNLYDSTKTILHRGNNLPGKNGTFFNVQFGDNSSNPRYEVLGVRAMYTPLSWRPE